MVPKRLQKIVFGLVIAYLSLVIVVFFFDKHLLHRIWAFSALCFFFIEYIFMVLASYWSKIKEAKELHDMSTRRTVQATGTIVGMAHCNLVSSGGQQVLPLAEFEANGSTHYASLTHMEVRPATTDEPAWGMTGKNFAVFLPKKCFESDSTPGHCERLQQRISDLRTKELSCNDISDWNRMRYEESIFSKLLPIGMEVTVTYDPDNLVNSEIVPYGDDTYSISNVVKASIVSCVLFLLIPLSLMIASGIQLAAL